MRHVSVRILHPASSPAAGELEGALEKARAANADRLAARFRSVGADDVRIEGGPPDRRSFGQRLRALVGGLGPGGGSVVDGRSTASGGLVILGSGSVPLLARRDAA